MKTFEIKTEKSDYPFLIIANGFKEAIEVLHNKGIYDTNIISIYQLETYHSDHILLEEVLTSEERIEKEVRQKLEKTLPRWKQMLNGAAGGGDKDIYLIRSSRGHYFTSKSVGGNNYYLTLESLEQLPGISEKD